jgi:hypothetical protein
MIRLMFAGVMALVVSGGAVSAQVPLIVPVTPPQAVAAPEKLTVTPIPRGVQRVAPGENDVWRVVSPRHEPTLLFGTPPKALTPAPIDCEMVKTLRHETALTLKVIPPPPSVTHHLKVVTVPPCPVKK